MNSPVDRRPVLRFLRWFLVLGVVFYLTLLTWNSLARTRLFSSDSMNYIDVARNLSGGRGLVQSTLGFNQPHLFDGDSEIPVPFTTQAPFYPVLIGAASLFGIDHADAALVISALAYGLILFVAYHLARTLYDEHVALLSAAALLVYSPMFFIARVAVSESVGILWILVSLLLLIGFRNATEGRQRAAICLLCGLTAGLAFATRYALLVLLPLALLYLAVESRGLKLVLRNLGLCLFGFSLPALPILAHNLAATGSLASTSLPSEVGLAANLWDMLSAIVGSNPLFGATGRLSNGQLAQLVLALSVALAIGIYLLARRRLGELRETCIQDGRWLLLAWSLAYLCFILCLRTLFNFDRLTARLVAPAAATLLILAIAIVVRTFGDAGAKWSIYLAVVLLAVAVGREILVTSLVPVGSDEQRIANSERLSWVARHTTQDDLIIGTDAVDIPFYLGRPAAVSFSEYPYTQHLRYEQLVSYAGSNCANYAHIYLVLRDHTWMEGDLDYRFGGFVSDLLTGNLDQYPDLLFLASFDGGLAFQILTCELGAPRPPLPVPKGAPSACTVLVCPSSPGTPFPLRKRGSLLSQR